MLREEIFRLFLRMSEAVAAAASGDTGPAAEMHAEMTKLLATLPYVERLGVPFDI